MTFISMINNQEATLHMIVQIDKILKISLIQLHPVLCSILQIFYGSWFAASEISLLLDDFLDLWRLFKQFHSQYTPTPTLFSRSVFSPFRYSNKSLSFSPRSFTGFSGHLLLWSSVSSLQKLLRKMMIFLLRGLQQVQP